MPVQLSTPIQPARMVLRPDERTYIAGMTGSGKSVMGRYLDRKWYQAAWTILIIDQDESWEIEGMTYAARPEEATVEHPLNITESGHLDPIARVQIFVPLLPAWDDLKFITLMGEVWERGGLVLHFDEIFGVVDNAHIPLIIKKLWAGGRKRKIVIIALSQRPADIPKIITSQAEVKIVFLILDPDDRERLAKMVGDPRIEHEVLPDYWHWYWRKGMRQAEKRGPLPKREAL